MKLYQGKILILIFGLCIVFSGVSFAKSLGGKDSSDSSVLLLRQLNAEGIEKRKLDLPIEKPDISGDTSRVQAEKNKFYEQKKRDFPSLFPYEQGNTKK